jgi:branched-chain amino acid transport system substrate-binding protein
MRCSFLVFVALSACSFTTATGFNECKTDSECGSGVCAQNYCLPLPKDCRKDEGEFNSANRVIFAALLPLHEGIDAGLDDSEAKSLNAFRLAISEANSRDALAGTKKFALISCDTQKDVRTLDQQLSWVVTNLKVPAVITSGSQQTRNAAQNADRMKAGTLIISATATSPALSELFKNDKNIWRMAPPDSSQAKVLAQLIRDTLSSADGGIAIMHDSGDYAAALASLLSDELRTQQFTPFRREYVLPLDDAATNDELQDATNNSVRASVIITSNVSNIVKLVSVATTPRFSKLQRANGHRWFMADGAKDLQLFTPTTLPELKDVLGTAPAQGIGTANAEFVTEYRNRFASSPNDTSYVSHSYDAMWLLMLSAAWASRQGEITGPNMGDAFSHFHAAVPSVAMLKSNWVSLSSKLLAGESVNVEGSSGTLAFDLSAGAPLTAPYEIWQGTDAGTFRTVKIVSAP